jgi:hypothetical protein
VARAKRSGTKGYVWDRLVGGLAIVVDVLAVALGGYAVRLGLLDSKLTKLEQPKLIGGIGAFILVLAFIHLIVDLGIFRSRRWAFIVLALLSGYGMWAGSVWSSGFMLTYTVLRLGQVFGPILR